MSRRSVHRLLVGLDEFEWIVKTVARKADLAKRMKTMKTLRAVITKFSDKLAQLPMPEATKDYVVPTNRNEAKFLLEVAQNEHAALVATVIPGYEERLYKAPNPEERSRIKDYRDGAILRSIMLAKLINTIRNTL